MATIEQLYGHLKTLTKQWFYDKTEMDTLLEAKLDAIDVPTKTSDLTNDGDGTHQFITKSDTSGFVLNDGSIDTSTYLTQHQDISMKANSADLHTVATTGSYTDLENIPSTFAPTQHGHSASEVTDANAYTNIGTTANATQTAINYAIDSAIGSLLAVELIEVVTTLPTASASTMNKLYMKPESTSASNDAYEIFVTVKTTEDNTDSYDWEKVDTARIDLSGKADVSHTHGNITNDGKVGSNADYFVYTTTGGAVTSKEKIGNITTAGTIGSNSGKVLVTGTDGIITVSDDVTEMDNTIQALITYGTSLEEEEGD